MVLRRIGKAYDRYFFQPIVEKIYGKKIADHPARRTGYRWLRGDTKLGVAGVISLFRGDPGALFEWINIILGQYDNGAHIRLADGKDHKVHIKEVDSPGLKWRKKNFDLISYTGLAAKGVAFTGMGMVKLLTGQAGGLSLTFTGGSLFAGALFLSFREPIDKFLTKPGKKSGKTKEEKLNNLNNWFKKSLVGSYVRPRLWLLQTKKHFNLMSVGTNLEKIEKYEETISRYIAKHGLTGQNINDNQKHSSKLDKLIAKVDGLQEKNHSLQEKIDSYSFDKINLSAISVGVTILDVQLYAMAYSGLDIAASGIEQGDLATVVYGAMFSSAANDYQIANTKPENLIGINHSMKGLENYDRDLEIQAWRKDKNPVSFAKMMFAKKVTAKDKVSA